MSSNPFGPTLVIQACQMTKEGRHGVYVVLEGRPEGIISFLLSVLGLGSKVRFEVSKNDVAKRTSSLGWRLTQAIPCRNVASTEFGYARRFLPLFFTVFFIFIAMGSLFAPNIAGALVLRDNGGAEPNDNIEGAADAPSPIAKRRADFLREIRNWYMVVAVVSFGAALFFLLVFCLSKRLVLQVESSGGKQVGISFRPGVVGGIPLTITTAEDIVVTISLLATIR